MNRPGARSGEHLIVIAAFVTMLGNNIQLIAASLLVYGSTGTALSVGWVYVVVAVPQVLLSAVFGALADRVDRRRLCIATDLTAALVAVALPVWIALGGPPAPAAYAVSLALALLAAVFVPANAALIKERVRPERLGRFNASYEVAFQAGALVSGVVGGFTVQAVGVQPLFVVNALTFLLSAACLFALGSHHGPVPAVRRAAGPATPGPAAPMPVGPRPIARLSGLYAIGSVLIVVSNTLLLTAVISRFHQGAGLLGVVDALAGVGMLIAAMTYVRLKDRVDYRYLVLAGYGVCAVAIVVQPLSVWTLLPAILIGGVAFGTGRLASRTELMRLVEEERSGRVFGIANGAGLAASVVATVIVATVADQVGVVPAFAALAALAAVPMVLIVASLFRPHVPRVPVADVEVLVGRRPESELELTHRRVLP